jgi:hypothetical protein
MIVNNRKLIGICVEVVVIKDFNKISINRLVEMNLSIEI